MRALFRGGCSFGMLLCSGVLSWPVMAAELTVQTDFPGGSAEVLVLDSAARRVEIEPRVQFGQGWPCWWYLRLDGAVPGERITLVVHRSRGEYRDSQRLAGRWALPLRAALSADDAHWEQTEPGDIGTESGTYTVVAPRERFWLAWGPPFLPSHGESLLKDAAARLPDSERFVLAETRGGRPVQGLRLGDGTRAHAIWVQARQHAWESGGSWVAGGFLQWVAGNEPAAVALRESTEIYWIPIMDVDNVSLGAGGKEAVPRDHNRDWTDDSAYPEVTAAQDRLLNLHSAGRLRLFLDLHNPGPGDKQPFFYGPFGYEDLPPESRRLYDRFLVLATERIRDPLPLMPTYRFATYVTTDEERGRMSSEWVRRHTGPDVVSMSLETAWNTPHSTIEGYESVGRELAEAVANYLHPASPAR